MSTGKKRGGLRKSVGNTADRTYLVCDWSINQDGKLVIVKKQNEKDKEQKSELFDILQTVGWQGKVAGVVEQGLLIFTSRHGKQLLLTHIFKH